VLTLAEPSEALALTRVDLGKLWGALILARGYLQRSSWAPSPPAVAPRLPV